MITQKRLKEVLNYDLNTGTWTWLISEQGGKNIGYKAGTLDKQGYIRIKIDYVCYRAHRLAFLYMLGKIPIQVDHKNHRRNDNRWINLRKANSLINHRNTSKTNKNKSGRVGVYKHTRRKNWVANISVNNKTVYLGCSKDFFEACCLRKSAEIKYNFHINHGS